MSRNASLRDLCTMTLLEIISPHDFYIMTLVTTKEIGDEEPYYSTKILIFSFILAGLAAYTKQAKYNEGCAKLNYLLPEV